MDLKVLEQVFLGNRLLDYIVSVVILCTSLLFVKVVIWVIVKRLKKIMDKTSVTSGDLLVKIAEKIILPGLYISCFYLSVKVLRLPSAINGVANALQLGVITFFAARVITMVISFGLNMYLARRQEDPAFVRSLEDMLKAVKFLVWVFAVIIFLDNVGYKVSAIIAGLGIGGVAVAIAAQAVLKDFFSYFSIVFDRPFKIGDLITIGDFAGTVEHIGIKTTRIRSLGGEQLIFSNSDLTNSRVSNYKLMEKRRILLRIGVTYQTPLDKLKEIPAMIEKIIKNTPNTTFDRAHFASYGDFSLVFEIVYFVLNPEQNKFRDVQQIINFAIKEEFEEQGIEFAYPTQTLYLKSA